MTAAPLPPNEEERLEALRALDILDSLPEEGFDRITRIASHVFGVPIALVSLVDEARQWFKSRVGLDATETPREHAFCAHAILTPDVMTVGDAQTDERFRNNPLVTGDPTIRFYAGAPLTISDDVRLGTLCVIDRVPRTMTPEQTACLQDLAGLVVDEMILRQNLFELAGAHQALLRKNEDLERFGHAVAHDVAAPLRHTSMYCEQLREDHQAELSHGAIEVLDRIERAASRGSTMVRELGRLSQLERPETLERKEVQIEALIRDVISGLRALAVDAEAEFNLNIETEKVFAHETYLREIFTNLIQNAFKYGGRPLRVGISVKTNPDGSYRCKVADHGAGIAEKHRERIFGPFLQLNPAASAGSGFGLALVRRLVEVHGGNVWVEETPGGGATFYFTLTAPAKRPARWTLLPRGSAPRPADPR